MFIESIGGCIEATLTLMMLLLSTRVWISDKTGSKLHRLLRSGDTPDGSAAEADALLSGSMFLYGHPPTSSPSVTYSRSETSHSSVPFLAMSPHPRIMTALPILPLENEPTAGQSSRLPACGGRKGGVEGGGCPEGGTSSLIICCN